jgi:N6-adenosine-specific RNA methylase IME4
MRFRTILADPPWSYNNKTVGGTGTSGSSVKYDTLTLADVHALPVPQLTDKENGACCYLWVPLPLLDEGLSVLDAWGFKYKTTITWVKEYIGKRLGMGWWYRGHVEVMLFGTCGPIKAYRSNIINVFSAPVRKHSQKPELAYTRIIEPVAPEPRIELFATAERKGWRVWGNGVARAKSYFDIFR